MSQNKKFLFAVNEKKINNLTMTLWSKEPEISLIIPVYNEEGNLTPLLHSIARVCSNIAHEIIVIDDGSSDGTLEELKNLRQTIADSMETVRLKTFYGPG